MKLATLQEQSRKEEVNPFYISFADVMMLLMVFFLLIVSISKVEKGSFEKISSAITGTTKGTLVELEAELKAIVNGDPGVPGVKVRMAKDGVRLDLDTATLFATASSSLRDGALDPLRPLFNRIRRTPYSLDVEGHTDDVRLHRRQGEDIETNWTLSGRRASSVIHHLLQMGFGKGRLRAVGYADNRPLESIKGKSGRGLTEARRQNRRVSILVK